jgi:hypothetical protein
LSANQNDGLKLPRRTLPLSLIFLLGAEIGKDGLKLPRRTLPLSLTFLLGAEIGLAFLGRRVILELPLVNSTKN